MSTTEKIAILIVDSQKLFRQAIAALIEEIDEFKVIGEFESGLSLLGYLAILNKTMEYIAIISLEMPGMYGIKLNDTIHQRYPNIKVIFLYTCLNPLLIAQIVDAKASAYLERNCDKYELLKAIRAVYQTGSYFTPQVLEVIKNTANYNNQQQDNFNHLPVKISERETEILRLICLQYYSHEIAEKLCVSKRTIENQRNILLNKTGCRNSTGLALFAVKYNLFIPKLGD